MISGHNKTGFIKLAALSLLLGSLASGGYAQGQSGKNEQKIREYIEIFKVNDHNYCVGVFRNLRAFGNEIVPIALEIYKESVNDRQKERIVLAFGGLQDERAVAFLIERLEQGDHAAPPALRDTGAFAAPALSKVLRSHNKEARAEAAVLLGKWGSGEGLPVLLEGLKEEPGKFKYSGIPDGFSFIGEPAVPRLTRALGDENARVRENAKYALNYMGRGELVVSSAADRKKDKTGPTKEAWRPKKLGVVLRNVTSLSPNRKEYDPKVWNFTISPDGGRIAYSLAYGGSGLWVMNSDGGRKSLVTRKVNPAGDFAWSSGGRLAFEEYESGNYLEGLGVAEFDGENRPAVKKVRKKLYPWIEEESKKGPVSVCKRLDSERKGRQNKIYSPGRSRYVYIEDNNIWLGYPGRAAAELITRNPKTGDHYFGNIIWSPDSGLIAYTLSVQAQKPLVAMWGGLDKYLCVLDVRKKLEERVPAPLGAVFRGLEWSPKGKKLYYAVDDIYLLDFKD